MSENGETEVGSADSVGGLTAGCSTAYPQAQFPPESVSCVFTLRYTSPGREEWRRLVCRTPPRLGTASCTVSPSLLSGEVVDSLTLQCWDSTWASCRDCLSPGMCGGRSEASSLNTALKLL